MKITLIKIRQNHYDVMDNEKQIGWFSKPENSKRFGFVHLRPFAISGDLLVAIGQELNKLNEALKQRKCHLRVL